MSAIIPGLLYLGNSEDASDDAFLRSKNIRFILNCTKEVDNTFSDTSIEELRIPVDDKLRPQDVIDMNAHIHRAVAEVEERVGAALPTLVHCRQGRQRSACVVAAYLMKTYDINMDFAVDVVRCLRKDVAFMPSINFWDSLIAYDRDRPH
jgi:protein-tyrosine phosphatase